ncbi:MAG: four helix bundle protein [bacterium]|nr:four helix bundle protein [bacterium]
MPNIQSPKPRGGHPFDLEERTTEFAKNVVVLCMSVPRTPINDRLTGQAVGAAGSIGANYREANDALGKKDFALRLKISRREAKECIHWLELLAVANLGKEKVLSTLLQEATELRNILSAIIKKCE